MKQRPDPETISSVLEYDALTGVLKWKPREQESFKSNKAGEAIRWNRRYSGKPAFTAKTNSGYFCGAVNKVVMQAHIVAWCIHYGTWPDGEIDHINGDRADNRIGNLRKVTRSENRRNSKTPKNNTSGVIGVSLYTHERKTPKWVASILSQPIGYFNTKEEAILARKDAEIKHKFHENHGRP